MRRPTCRRSPRRSCCARREHAVEWAAGDPLLLAGDFNVRPQSSTVFAQLERDFGLRGATAPDAIDHLLSRGLETVRPPAQWPIPRRELIVPHRGGTRRLRLSDHAPVEAAYLAAEPRML